MKDITRLVLVIIGIIAIFVWYNVWFGTDIVYMFFEPSAPEGFETLGEAIKLGAPKDQVAAKTAVTEASRLSTYVETGLWFLSTVGTIGLAIFSKFAQGIAFALDGVINRFFPQPEPEPTRDDGEPARMSRSELDVYSKVLIRAAMEGNKSLTVAMAEHIAGQKYLTQPGVK